MGHRMVKMRAANFLHVSLLHLLYTVGGGKFLVILCVLNNNHSDVFKPSTLALGLWLLSSLPSDSMSLERNSSPQQRRRIKRMPRRYFRMCVVFLKVLGVLRWGTMGAVCARRSLILLSTMPKLVYPGKHDCKDRQKR
jgi:hypothetical protein